MVGVHFHRRWLNFKFNALWSRALSSHMLDVNIYIYTFIIMILLKVAKNSHDHEHSLIYCGNLITIIIIMFLSSLSLNLPQQSHYHINAIGVVIFHFVSHALHAVTFGATSKSSFWHLNLTIRSCIELICAKTKQAFGSSWAFWLFLFSFIVSLYFDFFKVKFEFHIQWLLDLAWIFFRVRHWSIQKTNCGCETIHKKESKIKRSTKRNSKKKPQINKIHPLQHVS